MVLWRVPALACCACATATATATSNARPPRTHTASRAGTGAGTGATTGPRTGRRAPRHRRALLARVAAPATATPIAIDGTRVCIRLVMSRLCRGPPAVLRGDATIARPVLTLLALRAVTLWCGRAALSLAATHGHLR